MKRLLNKPLIILIPLLLLAACSRHSDTPYRNSNSKIAYYQLPVAGVTSTGSTVIKAKQLQITPIILTDLLSQQGIVYQIDPVRYVVASHNNWGSALDQQLQQQLINQLSQALPNYLVTSQPLLISQQASTITIHVDQFNGRYDGKAIVSGNWLWQTEQGAQQYPFQFTLDQPEDGYNALVVTLAKGWQQLAQTIATTIAAQR